MPDPTPVTPTHNTLDEFDEWRRQQRQPVVATPVPTSLSLAEFDEWRRQSTQQAAPRGEPPARQGLGGRVREVVWDKPGQLLDALQRRLPRLMQDPRAPIPGTGPEGRVAQATRPALAGALRLLDVPPSAVARTVESAASLLPGQKAPEPLTGKDPWGWVTQLSEDFRARPFAEQLGWDLLTGAASGVGQAGVGGPARVTVPPALPPNEALMSVMRGQRSATTPFPAIPARTVVRGEAALAAVRGEPAVRPPISANAEAMLGALRGERTGRAPAASRIEAAIAEARGPRSLEPTPAVTGTTPPDTEVRRIVRGAAEETPAPQGLVARGRNTLSNQSIWGALMLSKLFMGGGEASAVLRQALFATTAHPKEALAAGRLTARGAFSERVAEALQAELKELPRFAQAKAARLEITELGGGLRTAAKGAGEEPFMAAWARQVPAIGPFIKLSERLFTPYLNKLRLSIFDTVVSGWEHSGRHLTREALDEQAITQGFRDMATLRRLVGARPDRVSEAGRVLVEREAKQYLEQRQWANAVNLMTGRGKLGPLEKLRGPLNVVFWAPRLLASYPQLVYALVRPSTAPAVRKLIARDVAITLGTGLTILQAAKAAGADVESNPLSSDFGKIRVGQTRVNIWGGWQVFARTIAQTLMGKFKTVSTDEVMPLPEGRPGAVWNFFRYKLSPPVGLATDVVPALLSGETPTTPVGEEFGTDWNSIRDQALERLLPMWWGDLWEAWAEGGWQDVALMMPGFFGVSGQTFSTPIERFATESGEPFHPRQMTSDELRDLRTRMREAKGEDGVLDVAAQERRDRQFREDVRRIRERSR